MRLDESVFMMIDAVVLEYGITVFMLNTWYIHICNSAHMCIDSTRARG